MAEVTFSQETPIVSVLKLSRTNRVFKAGFFSSFNKINLIRVFQNHR